MKKALMCRALETLARREDLERELALEAFGALFDGEVNEAQAGAFLASLMTKGITGRELGAAVDAALERAMPMDAGGLSPLVDTCGTGGDGKRSFNCSTAVAFFLADMGYKVAKHGNRAVSSQCGSADVVEHLGLPFPEDPQGAREELEDKGFAFLFAPFFHPSFARLAPIRRNLGIITVFNIMGPLLNPARPTHQLVGVARWEFARIMAEVLSEQGLEAFALVHGAGGFDEITPLGPARVLFCRGDNIREMVLEPEALGIKPCDPKEIVFPSARDALQAQRDLFRGAGTRATKDMVALNLGLTLRLLEPDMPLSSCVERARDVVEQGISPKLGRHLNV